MRAIWRIAGLLALVAASCKEEEADFPATDPRLQTRRYCNDPSAVNYNWGFPGTADNAVCFYGADLFKGNYRYRDSIYKGDGTLDSARSGKDYTLDIRRVDSNTLTLGGFCDNGRILTLKAPRIGFRATFDSTGRKGQLFCSPPDTVNGYLVRDLRDTVSIGIFFNILTDSLTTVHRGTAYRR